MGRLMKIIGHVLVIGYLLSVAFQTFSMFAFIDVVFTKPCPNRTLQGLHDNDPPLLKSLQSNVELLCGENVFRQDTHYARFLHFRFRYQSSGSYQKKKYDLIDYNYKDNVDRPNDNDNDVDNEDTSQNNSHTRHDHDLNPLLKKLVADMDKDESVKQTTSVYYEFGNNESEINPPEQTYVKDLQNLDRYQINNADVETPDPTLQSKVFDNWNSSHDTIDDEESGNANISHTDSPQYDYSYSKNNDRYVRDTNRFQQSIKDNVTNTATSEMTSSAGMTTSPETQTFSEMQTSPEMQASAEMPNLPYLKTVPKMITLPEMSILREISVSSEKPSTMEMPTLSEMPTSSSEMTTFSSEFKTTSPEMPTTGTKPTSPEKSTPSSKLYKFVENPKPSEITQSSQALTATTITAKTTMRMWALPPPPPTTTTTTSTTTTETTSRPSVNQFPLSQNSASQTSKTSKLHITNKTDDGSLDFVTMTDQNKPNDTIIDTDGTDVKIAKDAEYGTQKDNFKANGNTTEAMHGNIINADVNVDDKDNDGVNDIIFDDNDIIDDDDGDDQILIRTHLNLLVSNIHYRKSMLSYGCTIYLCGLDTKSVEKQNTTKKYQSSYDGNYKKQTKTKNHPTNAKDNDIDISTVTTAAVTNSTYNSSSYNSHHSSGNKHIKSDSVYKNDKKYKYRTSDTNTINTRKHSSITITNVDDATNNRSVDDNVNEIAPIVKLTKNSQDDVIDRGRMKEEKRLVVKNLKPKSDESKKATETRHSYSISLKDDTTRRSSDIQIDSPTSSSPDDESQGQNSRSGNRHRRWIKTAAAASGKMDNYDNANRGRVMKRVYFSFYIGDIAVSSRCQLKRKVKEVLATDKTFEEYMRLMDEPIGISNKDNITRKIMFNTSKNMLNDTEVLKRNHAADTSNGANETGTEHGQRKFNNDKDVEYDLENKITKTDGDENRDDLRNNSVQIDKTESLRSDGNMNTKINGEAGTVGNQPLTDENQHRIKSDGDKRKLPGMLSIFLSILDERYEGGITGGLLQTMDAILSGKEEILKKGEGAPTIVDDKYMGHRSTFWRPTFDRMENRVDNNAHIVGNVSEDSGGSGSDGGGGHRNFGNSEHVETKKVNVVNDQKDYNDNDEDDSKDDTSATRDNGARTKGEKDRKMKTVIYSDDCDKRGKSFDLALYFHVFAMIASVFCGHSAYRNAVKARRQPGYMSVSTFVATTLGIISVVFWSGASDGETERHWSFWPHISCFFYILFSAILILSYQFFFDLRSPSDPANSSGYQSDQPFVEIGNDGTPTSLLFPATGLSVSMLDGDSGEENPPEAARKPDESTPLLDHVSLTDNQKSLQDTKNSGDQTLPPNGASAGEMTPIGKSSTTFVNMTVA